VSIIRLRAAAPPDALLDALVAGGVESVEVTLNTPGALDTIGRWAARGVARVGVGTVRTARQAAAAIDAGAQFLVTPTTVPAVLETARGRGVPVACGALTPTEIDLAWSGGADVVKVFPVSDAGGPGYLRAVSEPLDDVPLLPTGGVRVDDLAAYARAGAVGVGVGGSLVGEALVAAGDWEAVAARARSWTTRWREARDG